MKITIGRQRRDGFVLIVIVITMIIVGFIAVLYHAKSQVNDSEERRRARESNELTSQLDRLPNNWLISIPPSANVSYTNGVAYVDIPDQDAAAIFATVAQYQIQHADTIGGEWTNTEAEPIWADLNSMRDIMTAFARIDSIICSNSPAGFYRAVKLP